MAGGVGGRAGHVMTLCSSCGLQISGDVALCPHHHYHDAYGVDWAVANRIICDLLHRGKVPPRLLQSERDAEFWASASDVG